MKPRDLTSFHPDNRHIHIKLSHYCHLPPTICLKQRTGKSITEYVLSVRIDLSAFGYLSDDVLSQVERDILPLVLILKLEQLFVGSMFW